MRMFVLAALLAGTAATPALAQDRAPFTGPRVEGIVGYENVAVPGPNSDGATYGVGVGYDWQMGNAVVGVEAEASDSSTDECTRDYLVTGDELCAQVGRDLYVGGRVGAVISPNALLYGKLGYVNGRLQTQYDDGTANNATGFETGDNLDGVRAGIGLEYALGPSTYVKAEYRYSNYEQGYEKHQGVVGIGFRF